LVSDQSKFIHNNNQMQMKPQKILFELPRPRGRNRCSPEAAKAGYWHRRATAIEKKLASVSREANEAKEAAAEAKEAAAEATTKIAAMENTIVLMQEMLQNASAEGTEAEEEVATAQDDELDELMVLTAGAEAEKEKAAAELEEVRKEVLALQTEAVHLKEETAEAEAKARRNKEWQDKFFKWWNLWERTGLQQKHKQDRLRLLILRWRVEALMRLLIDRQEAGAPFHYQCEYIGRMYEAGDVSRKTAEALKQLLFVRKEYAGMSNAWERAQVRESVDKNVFRL